jgi:predicted AAA+ superfamily ATPase
MAEPDDPLSRIAEALQRLAPPSAGETDWLSAPAYLWDGSVGRPIERVEAPALALLKGIDRQKQAVCDNIARLAAGYPAHDMLLWGARGMGKSALVRAALVAAQNGAPERLALVQTGTVALDTLPALFDRLGREDRNFLVYIDDLGFGEDDAHGPRHLRSWLEGGIEARPANVRLAVTSNRRAIVPRQMSEQDDPINPRDVVDDRLALADRFGLSLGFHACSQGEYLDIVRGYADAYELAWDETEALVWARRRGGRSGRVAWHYVVEVAGGAGKRI